MDIHPTDLLLNIINIIILFFFLRLILWKPLYRFLLARAESVKQTMESAEQAKTEALALKDEYQKRMDDLQDEGQKIVQRSHVQAEENAKAIAAEAQAQAERILAEVRVKAEAEKSAAVAQAQAEIARLATGMAANILRREITTSDNIEAAKKFFAESR